MVGGLEKSIQGVCLGFTVSKCVRVYILLHPNFHLFYDDGIKIALLTRELKKNECLNPIKIKICVFNVHKTIAYVTHKHQKNSCEMNGKRPAADIYLTQMKVIKIDFVGKERIERSAQQHSKFFYFNL